MYARGQTQNRQTDRHGHHNTPSPPIGVGVNNNNLPDSGVGNMSGVRSDHVSKSPSKSLRDRPSFTFAPRGHNYLTFVLTRIRAVHKVCPALTHSSWRKTACSVLVSRYIIVTCRRQYCLLSRTCVRRLLYFTGLFKTTAADMCIHRLPSPCFLLEFSVEKAHVDAQLTMTVHDTQTNSGQVDVYR